MIVAVQTRSVLREIVVDGARRLSAKRMRKEIAIKINSSVNEEELEKGRQKILEIYQVHGFNDVEVNFDVDPMEAKRGTSRVVFTINEGVKGAVKQIRFEGNEHFKEAVLRKQMKTKGKTFIAFLDKSGRLDETQLQQDLDSIREWYQNHGYIDVEVKDVRKEREKGPHHYHDRDQGRDPIPRGQADHHGREDNHRAKDPRHLKMKEGTVYSPKALHDDAKAMADAYGSGGYVDLGHSPQKAPRPVRAASMSTTRSRKATARLLQRINIIGNTRTKDKVIRREVLVAPGDVFQHGAGGYEQEASR